MTILNETPFCSTTPDFNSTGGRIEIEGLVCWAEQPQYDYGSDISDDDGLRRHH